MRMRNISKKSLIITLSYVILIFAFLCIVFKNDKGIKVSAISKFNNDFSVFNSLINSDSENTIDVIDYNSIHNVIENYMNDSSLTNSSRDELMSREILNMTNGKRVSISTADELYNLSIDACYNWKNKATANIYPNLKTIGVVLGLNYCLLDDIDYSKMKSKQFIPLGIDFTIPDENKTRIYYPFTGTFDGNGFKISNLYLAGYDYISMIYRFNQDDQSTEVDIALNNYYSMFANVEKSGIVCNLVIENPIFELLDIPDGLTKTAVLVGENKGLIYNTAVIDNRVKITSQGQVDDSGISWSLQYGAVQTQTFYASGLVNKNDTTGKIYNSYYIGGRIVKSSSSYLFKSYPVVCENSGEISGVCYNENLISSENINVSGINKYSIEVINKGTNININDVLLSSKGIEDDRVWHFYSEDCLPTLIGLKYDEVNKCYLIEKDLDLVNFSKLLSYKTITYGKKFNEHTYVLVNNIDMKNISNYQTPKNEFKGVFKGGDIDLSLDSRTNENKCILNLKINKSYYTESEIYYGLFGINKGIVKNINFVDATINLVGDKNDYGKSVYVGVVSGVLDGGIIKNITNRVKNNNSFINATNSGLGKTYIGGLVGYGSGSISFVSNINGVIDGTSSHDYTNIDVTPEYYYGGIIGGSSESGLRIEYAYNNADVKTIGNKEIDFYVNKGIISAGGIIGNMNNLSDTSNEYFYLTNSGRIEGKLISDTNANLYLGGIFGRSINMGIEISKDNKNLISGRLENNGTIVSKYNAYTMNYLAGIGVNNSLSEKVSFSYMINNGSYDIEGYNSENNNSNIYYSATILDNGNGVKLSRAYNESSFTYESSFFVDTMGIIMISPFFVSVNDSSSELLYCQNNGNIVVDGENASVYNEIRVAGITLANKVDYKNVTMCGDIKVINIKNERNIYVSGISWILTTKSRVYKAVDCLNEGNIITSSISGETTISNVRGTGQTDTSFSATITGHNLYVAGLFNLNVGEITNSMNRGDITSDNGNGETITGTCNTFVGGLVTFNYNLIQDCANSGDITYINSSNGTTYVAGGDVPNCLYGGLIFAYNGGLALGGISSAMADTSADVLSDYSDTLVQPAQILDSSNNGNVSGKANQYVRSGGILAVALGVELTAGTDSINSTNNGGKKFSWCTVGNGDKIANCKLSNGMNFGNIVAISNKIGSIDGTICTGGNGNNSIDNMQAKRPGIFACSGGVISYGLCIMTRMLNHGVIVSTDVGGGIIGATYVLGKNENTNELTVTYCNIDTAIHYGKVKAAKYSNYNGFTYEVLKDITNSRYMNDNSDTNYIYKDENTFIFPRQSESLSIYPNNRRGFGGIFGRLQRGNSGIMQTNNFSNILNMDPKVDMIGRADGTSYQAYYFYRFKVAGKKDTYYSARSNDTTPCLIVGYVSSTTTNYSRFTDKLSDSDISSISITRRRGRGGNYTYSITSVTLRSGEYERVTSYNRTYGEYNANINTTNYQRGSQETIEKVTSEKISSSKTITTTINVDATQVVKKTATGSITTVKDLFDTSGGGNQNVTVTVTNPTDISELLKSITFDRSNSGSNNSINQYQMEIVTDDIDDISKTYIFDEEFPLMDATQANYIYAANNDALADRFKLQTSVNYKPNGMYVLASTKGRDAGDVLPGNLKINNLFKLSEGNEAKYIDLKNVKSDDLITDGDNVDEILTDYKSMFQISYSDKSLIQQYSENDSNLYDIVLYDKNNLSPILRGGVVGVDSDGMATITFRVSNSAFNFINNQVDLSYSVKSAILSENAVIAKSGVTSLNHDSFRTYYSKRTSNILEGEYEALLTGTLTKNSRLEFSEKLRVYSEIACEISGLVEKYVTDYKVIIECISEDLEVDLSSFVDGNSSSITSSIGSYVINNPMLPDGSLKCLFTDKNNVLPTNHELTFVGIYKDGILIDEMYYQLEMFGLDSNKQYGFNIIFSDKLKSGDYEIRYKHYGNVSDYESIYVNKKESEYFSINNVLYNTYSYDVDGKIVDFLEKKNTNFTTYIQFGYVFANIFKDISNSVDLTIEAVINNNQLSYLNNIEAYIIKANGIEIERVYVSEFSEIISANAYYTYSNGNREYIITYSIKNEIGNVNTIVHSIVEREPESIIIYKNSNMQHGTTFTVLREDVLTTFDIDFGFGIDRDLLNTQIKMLFNNLDFDEETMKDKIYISVGSYYSVNITSLLETGTNSYKFVLVRDGEEKDMLNIVIDKLLGTNAYLEDINFQLDSDTALVYPNIYEVDSLGNSLNSSYDVRAYYGGIDYDNADVNNVRYFRIDGKVTNISLDDYSPLFTSPLGSKVYRYTGDNWDGSDTNNWSSELKGDFIGSDEEKDTVILYKVVSEDGQSTVYYFITATDILYNLTIRFTIYYRFANGNIVLGSDASSPIRNQVVVITIKNYNLEGELTDYTISIDPNDPNHTIYPYEASESDKEGITKYIKGLNNQMTMFYYPLDVNKYQYSFGRNYSGCYGFTAITPTYKGENTEDLINGRRYEYDIYLTTGAKDWNDEAYKLPDLDNDNKYDGKYFFIGGSTRNRIREFALVVNEKTLSKSWGLTDEDISWDK